MTFSIPGDYRTKVQTSSTIGDIDSPFTRTRAVLDMMKGWEIMKAVTEGTEYLRENSEAFFTIRTKRRLHGLHGKSKSCCIFSFYPKIDKSSYRFSS